MVCTNYRRTELARVLIDLGTRYRQDHRLVDTRCSALRDDGRSLRSFLEGLYDDDVRDNLDWPSTILRRKCQRHVPAHLVGPSRLPFGYVARREERHDWPLTT